MRLCPGMQASSLWLALALVAPPAAGAAPQHPTERERLERLAAELERSRTEPVDDVQALGAEALRLLERQPDLELATPELAIQIRLDLSWAASQRGDPAEGLALAESARSIAGGLELDALGARADYHLALAHWYRSELAEALSSANRARRIQAEARDGEELARTLTLLGAIHRSTSDWGRSLACHFGALRIAEELGDPEAVARSNNNIALVYWALDLEQRAAEYLERVVPVYRKTRDTARLSTALSNYGLMLIELGEPARALPILEEGRVACSAIDRPRSLARILSNLGFAHAELGESERAMDYYLQSLELREALDDPWGISRSLAAIAHLHRVAGELDRAVELYERAAREAERGEAREEHSSVLKVLAACYEEQGRLEQSLVALRKHTELVEELDPSRAASLIAQFEARGELRAAERDHRDRTRQQRARQQILAGTSVLFLLFAGILLRLSRSRAKSLEEVRRSHERLLESERRYRSVFEDAVVPKFLIDLERGRLIEANGPGSRLCGRAPGALESQPLSQLAPPWLASALAAFGEGDDVVARDWQDADGETRHAELRSSPLAPAGRACTVITVHDVTEARRREEERLRIERLESLGLLAGGIAHDFNNALTGALGHVSLARCKNADPRVTPHLGDAEQGIGHATHLTNQLLAFAKGGEPRRRPSDVTRLLWDAVHFALSGSNVSVEFDLAPDLAAVELDPSQFRQVISNLVINASQAMPQGGLLRVSARNLALAHPSAPAAGASDHVRIDLEDDGPGIPPELQAKVLDPYFTTKTEGSGLGLSTAYAIVSRHGGWMELSSDGERGTRVSLYFAACEGTPDPQEPAQPVPARGSGSILVMDDDPMVQLVFRAALPELGYRVELVDDGRAALESWFAARERGEPFDAVIMDLTIPGGMGGREAMAELRRRDPEAIGIVVSGYSKDPVMSDCKRAGFAASLAKPFNISSLGQLLAGLLAQRPEDVVIHPAPPGNGRPEATPKDRVATRRKNPDLLSPRTDPGH